MERFWQKFSLSLLTFLVWGMLTVMLLTGCVSTRIIPVLMTEGLDSTDINRGVEGRVDCDSLGNPVIKLKQEVYKDRRDEIIYHEMVHVDQAFRHGGCKKMSKRYENDPVFALKIEAEAYCKTAQVFDPGLAGQLSKAYHVHKLYGEKAKFSYEMVKLVFETYCPGVTNGTNHHTRKGNSGGLSE